MAEANHERPNFDASEFDRGSEFGEETVAMDRSAAPSGATALGAETPAPAEPAASADPLAESDDDALSEEEQAAIREEERAAQEAEARLLVLFQSTVYGPHDEKIGKVGQVYLDDQTQEPNWVTVKTGLFGTKEFFVPLDLAERHERQIRVPYSKELVTSAPRTEIDQNLSPEEEDRLYAHYEVPGRATDLAEKPDENAAADTTPVAGTDAAPQETAVIDDTNLTPETAEAAAKQGTASLPADAAVTAHPDVDAASATPTDYSAFAPTDAPVEAPSTPDADDLPTSR